MPLLQPLPGGVGNAALSGVGTTQYNYLCGAGGTWATTDSAREQVVAQDGSFRNMTVELTVAPGAGTSRTFQHYINGVATGTGVTISDTDTSGSSSEIVTVSAGDIITVQCSNSGSPAAAFARYGCSWVPDSARPQGGFQTTGSAFSQHTTATTYTTVCPANIGWTTTSGVTRTVWPESGTFDTLFVALTTAPGAGTSRDYTVLKNAVATSLTTTIADTATTGTDLANSIALVDTDDLSYRSIPTNTPAATFPRVGAVYESGTANNSVFVTTGLGAALSTTAASYNSTWSGHLSWSTSASIYFMLSGGDDVTLKKIRANLNAAPGAGSSFTLAVATGTTPVNTALAVTIADTNSTGTTSADVDLSAGTVVTIKSTPSGTPASRSCNLSYVVNAFIDGAVNGGVTSVVRAWRRLRR